MKFYWLKVKKSVREVEIYSWSSEDLVKSDWLLAGRCQSVEASRPPVCTQPNVTNEVTH